MFQKANSIENIKKDNENEEKFITKENYKFFLYENFIKLFFYGKITQSKYNSKYLYKGEFDENTVEKLRKKYEYDGELKTFSIEDAYNLQFLVNLVENTLKKMYEYTCNTKGVLIITPLGNGSLIRIPIDSKEFKKDFNKIGQLNNFTGRYEIILTSYGQKIANTTEERLFFEHNDNYKFEKFLNAIYNITGDTKICYQYFEDEGGIMYQVIN